MSFVLYFRFTFDILQVCLPTLLLCSRCDLPDTRSPRPVSLRGALEMIALPLARSASSLVETQGWTELGHARLENHSRERFGRSGRWVNDLAALGRMFSRESGYAAGFRGAGERRRSI